jgi:hypothetical protein
VPEVAVGEALRKDETKPVSRPISVPILERLDKFGIYGKIVGVKELTQDEIYQ